MDELKWEKKRTICFSLDPLTLYLTIHDEGKSWTGGSAVTLVLSEGPGSIPSISMATPNSTTPVPGYQMSHKII